LCALNSAGYGAGPGNVAVSDLTILDLDSGTFRTLIADGAVEALYAPSGIELAYILATPSTYELHWRDADGSDRLLASDVSFTWSIAPSGQAVAFTRESGYGLSVDPGLFVASVDAAEVIRVSAVDKAGSGSTADVPVWSPDSAQILLADWGSGPAAELIFANADGSGDDGLAIDPALASNGWATIAIPTILWAPDGETLVVSPAACAEPYGPSPVVRYHLDRRASLLRQGALLAEAGTPIAWENPGESL
jgi:hypothetical protein